MDVRGAIILKKGREVSVRRFHPWIFSGAIGKMEGSLGDGDWTEVREQSGRIVGYGHYQPGSIAVRLLSFGEERPNSGFWIDKIQKAVGLRRRSGLPSDHTNCYRLLHAEGDGLSGLICDIYGGVAVLQAHSTGMHADRHAILDALTNVLEGDLKSVYYKSQSTLPGKLRGESAEEFVWGESVAEQIVFENGNKFLVNWVEGQKTGFFLDQRDNRLLLQKFCAGTNVLNTFCYTGGFSIYALTAGARLVHSVDSSQKAIDMTSRNIALNGFDPDQHQCYATDTFDFFKEQTQQYDVIVLDPPAFAKHRDARHQAVKGYQRLNAEAMRRIGKGGVLFTFSCSQVIDRQLFYDTIISAGIQAARRIKVIHHLSQPADHPVSIFHPEGEYLKGLVLFIE